MRLPTLCSRLAVYPLAAACLRLPTLCSRLAVYPLAAACLRLPTLCSRLAVYLRLPTLCSRLAVYPLAAACLRLPTLCSRLAVYPLAAACLRLPTLCSRLAVYPLAASGGASIHQKTKKRGGARPPPFVCGGIVFTLFLPSFHTLQGRRQYPPPLSRRRQICRFYQAQRRRKVLCKMPCTSFYSMPFL